LLSSQASAADSDVYDCTIVEALYLTPEGYKPHEGDRQTYVSHHLVINKDSGMVTGPSLFSGGLRWKRISAPTDYSFFETVGYGAIGDRPVMDVFVNEFTYSDKKLNWPLSFVAIDQLDLNILDGFCKR
jgi:hypothetical protein